MFRQVLGWHLYGVRIIKLFLITGEELIMNKSFENTRNSFGYQNRNSSFEYRNPNDSSPLKEGHFIPLESSSPNNFTNKRYQGKWRSPRGQDRFKKERRNSFQQFKSTSSSPYELNRSNLTFTSPRSPSDWHRSHSNKKKFDIADYFNPKSIFGDPWKELVEVHLAKSAKSNTSNDSSSTTSQESPSNSNSINVTNDYSFSQDLMNTSSSSELSIDVLVEQNE